MFYRENDVQNNVRMVISSRMMSLKILEKTKRMKSDVNILILSDILQKWNEMKIHENLFDEFL